MLPQQSTCNLSDSQGGGRDGARGSGGGGGGSSSGFLTSDNDNEHENEYTDEPLSFHNDSRSRNWNTLGGAAEKAGTGKHATTTTTAAAADDGYEREYEDEDDGLRSAGSAAEMSSFVQSQQAQAAQSSSTTTSGRVKRPTRKSSSKALFPSSSALHSATATNITSTRNQQQSSSSSRAKKGTLKQNLAIAFLVILGLFLLGTVIVLSTIKRYFAIPDWAYLSEAEIGGWPSSPGGGGHVEGLIPSLVELNSSSMPLAGGGGTTYDGEEGEQGGSVWGPNGEGTGGYWMRRDWRGQVADTDSWERLYNVSTRYVPPARSSLSLAVILIMCWTWADRVRPGERIPRIIHQTWKSDVLPEKWRKIWMECREGMPD
ncbi:hypothetical protein QFC22_005284 [Naganishia vaughanmartiniae]|uniref:Uncharacterized protein n=1 Tax=Naganishia vaughanmartiniae TaxID=1424756 RepID=A0ACC2WUQ2_9TREE|nr:hypothetical protein QFC22_005284 [Naganishia vaughanmartiniae]